MKYITFVICWIFISFQCNLFAEDLYIDARNNDVNIAYGHLMMGNPGPKGKEIEVNSKFLLLNGKPIIPVMGEVHYARVNKERWEDVILKMKAAGINIIATYVFWIHHEEEEGTFDWTGNKDLREFILLCQKHDLWVYPRIGPWCHGEARNGGLPDWIVKRKDFSVRSNDSAYLYYAERWYKEIADQLDGLYYKDQGPVIGIQLENEYWRGKGGEDHILWLKKTAIKYGMDVPLYTITGWRNTSLPEYEVIPLWGGYPATPWNTNIDKITQNESYVFSKPVNDESIGNKETGGKYSPDYTPYPYFTCELGVGNQISEHRRPVLDPLDGYAIVVGSLASGSNLPGYYVFAGGRNPVGKYTTMEEDKIESGYWNEYPDISYDFQASIRETGEIAPSYQKVKLIHYFLHEYGEQLAPMKPVIPSDNKGTDDLQYAFRAKGNEGFLFVSNYYRGHQKSSKKDVRFNIQLEEETISLPGKPVTITDSSVFIWPVNMKMGQFLLKYASAQPICDINNNDYHDWYFFQSNDIVPEFVLSRDNIASVHLNGKSYVKKNNVYHVNALHTGLGNPLIIQSNNLKKTRIFVLDKYEAEQFWYFRNENNEFAFISGSNLYMNENLTLTAISNEDKIEVIPLNKRIEISNNDKPADLFNENFQKYTILNETLNPVIHIQHRDIKDEVQWLVVNDRKYEKKRMMYRNLFVKDFDLLNTADIRKAIFYIITDVECDIRINGKWINQSVTRENVNKLDITAYVQLGENDILLSFPYSGHEEYFTGVIEAEFYNSDKEYILVDTTWHTSLQYKIPAPWESIKMNKPVVANEPAKYQSMSFTPHRYAIQTDLSSLQDQNVYLHIIYGGDKAQGRLGKELVSDNFNNGTIWAVNLNDIGYTGDKEFMVEIQPFNENPLIYFERKMELTNTGIDKVSVSEEYKATFKVNE